MVKRLKKYHTDIKDDASIVSAIMCFLILIGLLLNNGIPIILMFIYVAVFNKKFTIAVLFTLPLYNAYLELHWLTISKISILIMIVVFIFNISIKKMKMEFYEWLIILLVAIVSFSYIVASVNSSFAFMRDEIYTEYIFNSMPKLLFILAFIFIVRTSEKFNMKKMVETAVIFIPFIVIVIAGVSVSTRINLTARRYILMNIRPNYFAFFITSMVPFVLKAYFNSTRKHMVVLSLVAMCMIIYLVSLTASRTGFILLIVSSVISILLFSYKKKLKLRYLIVLVAIGIVVAFFLPVFHDAFFRMFRSSDITYQIFPRRTNLLKSSFESFVKNPIIGYGGIKVASLIVNYYNIGLSAESHNFYLDIALQYGIAGTIVYGLLFLSFISEFIIKIIKNRVEYGWQFPLYIVFINILIAGLVLSLNFRDFQIYNIAFLAALPYRREIQ